MNTSKTLFHITGRVEEEYGFNLEELMDMDTVETGDLLLACGSGEPKGRIPGCRGVLLTDIINTVKVIAPDHNDTKRMYLEVHASDGYCTVFSWQELFNTATGEGVMVILEKGGKKLFEESGRVDLFSARDILTGPRYVKDLSSIRICMI